MAVLYTSLAPLAGLSKASKVVSTGWARQVVTATAIISLATTTIDNANDDVGLFWVPAGAVPVGIAVGVTDVDSGTAFVFDIGDVDDEDRLVAGATTGQAEGVTTALAYAGMLYKYAAATEIRFYCKTASGTPVAGTMKVALSYFVDPDFSTTALTPSATA